ncbi:MAG TPA: winged helix-turn-helix transcriptional regulator [Candidatus Thermoplasmatota archaeon]
MEEADSQALGAGFSARKKDILLALKRTPSLSLAHLSGQVGISKMAALKHLNTLEARGFVEREYKAHGRGRPSVHFSLAPKAAQLFPQAYTELTTAALGFVEEKLGRKGVVELLERRGRELYDRHRAEFQGKPLAERVETLAKVRDDAGYIAEVSARRRDSFELKEHNCPILAVAGEYWEACTAETRLFERLLGADVEASHRVVAGDAVCCFQIRRRSAK